MSTRPFLTTMLALALGLLVGCSSSASEVRRPAEQLYLAVEVHENGKRVAAPKLLGFEGHQVVAARHSEGGRDYKLTLRPQENGSGYRVFLDLDLPSGHREGRIGLLHGEERHIALDAQTELSLLLMRVDSPEFRALMRPQLAHDAI
jgi:hypothetical protein